MAFFSVEAQNLPKWYAEYERFINTIQLKVCQNLEESEFKLKLLRLMESNIVNSVREELICKQTLSIEDKKLFHNVDVQIRELQLEALKFWPEDMESFLHNRLDEPFPFFDVINTIPYRSNGFNRIYQLPPEIAFQTVDPPKPSDKFFLVIPNDDDALRESLHNFQRPLLLSIHHVYSKNVQRQVCRWLDENNNPAGKEKVSILPNSEDYRVFTAIPDNGQQEKYEFFKRIDDLVEGVKNRFHPKVREERDSRVIYCPNLIEELVDNPEFNQKTIIEYPPTRQFQQVKKRKSRCKTSENSFPNGLSVAAEVFFKDGEEEYPKVGETCILYISNQNTFQMLYKNIQYEIPENCFHIVNNVYKIYVESLHSCPIVKPTKAKRGRPSRKTIQERTSYSTTSCDSGTSTLRPFSEYESPSKSMTLKNMKPKKMSNEIISIEDGIFEERSLKSLANSQEIGPLTIDMTPTCQLDQHNHVIGKQSILVDLERGMNKFFDESIVNDEEIDLSEAFFRENLCVDGYTHRTSTPLNSCPSSPRSDCSFTFLTDVPNKNVGSGKRSITVADKIQPINRHSVDSCSSSSSISNLHRSQSHRISMSPIPYVPPSPKRSKVSQARHTIARKSQPKPEIYDSSTAKMFPQINGNAYFSIRTRSSSRRKTVANGNRDLNDNIQELHFP